MISNINSIVDYKSCIFIIANKLALMELDRSLSGTKTFLIGALANAIATLITYPIQVVQAKMRVSNSSFKFFTS